MGVSSPTDYMNSVAVSIPFEFVGNYGWLIGALSFAALGALWSLLCGLLLSVPRLADHPLSPYFVVLALSFELPFGSFLASLRDLAFPRTWSWPAFRWPCGAISESIVMFP